MAEPFTIYKLMVLYMAQHSRKELTNSQISEFVLDRDYTDYFIFSRCCRRVFVETRTSETENRFQQFSLRADR